MTLSFEERFLGDETIFNYENSYGANHYHRLPFVPRWRNGVWLYDNRGKKCLDCLSAYSAVNQGHNHPTIVKAMIHALEENQGSVVSNVAYTDVNALFLQRLATFVPLLAPRFNKSGRNKVLLKNGGVESVETAIKTARYYGYKQKGIKDGDQEIIVFKNNFHGRTISVISFSSTEKYREGFGPLTPGFREAVFGDHESVKNLINENTCAILLEPMQGEGGVNIPPDGFLKELRAIADINDLLLIFDEIQVGLGRTGKMFCFEHEGVIPDGLILGKALSGGFLAVSAFVTSRELMDMVFRPGSDGSTFGGSPLGCFAGLAALKVLEEEKLVENSAKMGKILKEKIEAIAKKSSHIKEVRGKGLFIGIEVKDGEAMKYCRELLKLGLFVNDSYGHTIRISPPLIITEKEVDYIVERLEKVLV